MLALLWNIIIGYLLLFLFSYPIYVIAHRRQYKFYRKIENFLYEFDKRNRERFVVYRYVSKTVVQLGEIAIFLGWLLVLFGYFVFLYKMIFGFFGLASW
jgi:hypothetical protein